MLAELALAFYLKGSLGIQGGYAVEDGSYYARGVTHNDYGLVIGEASIVTEPLYGFYGELKHVSGISTEEFDFGLNAIQLGYTINGGPVYMKAAVGKVLQLNEAAPSHNFGNTFIEFGVGLNFGENLFIEAKYIDDQSIIQAGMKGYF